MKKPRPAIYALPKVHFAFRDIVFCQVKPSFKTKLELTNNWGCVTCGNCIQGKASRAWKEFMNVQSSVHKKERQM